LYKLTLGLTFALAVAAQPADLIYHNGKIITVSESQPVAQAVAIRGNRFLAVGSNAEVMKTRVGSTRFIQLPFNLAMREGLVNRVMEEAHARGVTVVTSASILQSRLVSLDAQLAIQFARSAEGVTVSLVGMGRHEHVEENLGVAALPPLTREEFDSVLEKL
jgi:aryl-alcohol dehydrogenase-like predicted oxidoreductase